MTSLAMESASMPRWKEGSAAADERRRERRRSGMAGRGVCTSGSHILYSEEINERSALNTFRSED